MKQSANGKGKTVLTLCLGVFMILGSTLMVDAFLAGAMEPEWAATPAPAQPSAPQERDALPPPPSENPAETPGEALRALEAFYNELMATGQSREWTLAEKAKYDDLRLAAGVPIGDAFRNGLPGPADLPQADAVRAAGDAIRRKYALKAEALAKYTPSVAFNIADPERPLWQISFLALDPGDFQLLGDITVRLDARTGEIQTIVSGSPANG